MPSWINIPNLLTLLRLILVPFILQAIVAGRHTLALSLFGFAAFTDVVDGAIARRFGLSTQAGAYLDPVADKCLLSGVYLALAVAGIVPWWLVIVIFGRDIYILAGAAAFMAFTSVRKLPPSVWGKASTFVQICTAVVFMANNVLENGLLRAISSVLLWPCAGLAIWSGVHYTYRSIREYVRIDAISHGE
jgi:cardiolipin synthase